MYSILFRIGPHRLQLHQLHTTNHPSYTATQPSHQYLYRLGSAEYRKFPYSHEQRRYPSLSTRIHGTITLGYYLLFFFSERDRIQAERISIDSRKLEDRTFFPQIINEVRYLNGTDQPEGRSY